MDGTLLQHPMCSWHFAENKPSHFGRSHCAERCALFSHLLYLLMTVYSARPCCAGFSLFFFFILLGVLVRWRTESKENWIVVVHIRYFGIPQHEFRWRFLRFFLWHTAKRPKMPNVAMSSEEELFTAERTLPFCEWSYFTISLFTSCWQKMHSHYMYIY